MKRKRTNLKQYIKDRWMYKSESILNRECRKFLDSMTSPHVSYSYTLNGVPMDEFVMNVIINNNFFKIVTHESFNPFENDISETLNSYFGTGIEIKNTDEIFKLKTPPTA